jgi:hypothetical protein
MCEICNIYYYFTGGEEVTLAQDVPGRIVVLIFRSVIIMIETMNFTKESLVIMLKKKKSKKK